MIDPILKSEKFQAIVLAWFVPALCVALVVTSLIFPAIDDLELFQLLSDSTKRLGVNPAVSIGLVSALAASVAWNFSDHILDLVSGRSWPAWLRRHLVDRRHRPQAVYLESLREGLRASIAGDVDLVQRWNDALAHERHVRSLRGRAPLAEGQSTSLWESAVRSFPRRGRPFFTVPDQGLKDRSKLGLNAQDWVPTYPQNLDWVEPTIVGNHIAAALSQGTSKYGLDATTLRPQLESVVPENLAKGLTAARLRVDSYLAVWFFTLAGSAVSTVLLAVAREPLDSWSWVAPLACLAASWWAHRTLPRSVDRWGDHVEALVSTARVPLAKAHQLTIPTDPAQEHQMWSALTGFLYYPGSETYAQQLERFRSPPEAPSTNASNPRAS